MCATLVVLLRIAWCSTAMRPRTELPIQHREKIRDASPDGMTANHPADETTYRPGEDDLPSMRRMAIMASPAVAGGSTGIHGSERWWRRWGVAADEHECGE